MNIELLKQWARATGFHLKKQGPYRYWLVDNESDELQAIVDARTLRSAPEAVIKRWLKKV